METFDNLQLLTVTLSQQHTGEALLLFHGKLWLRESAICYVACTLPMCLVNILPLDLRRQLIPGGGVFTTVVHNMKLSNGDASILRLLLSTSLSRNRKEHGF